MVKHLSYSSVNTFDRCPKAFFLSRVINAQPLPAVYFALGTAVHKITEDVDRTATASAQSVTNVSRYTGSDFRDVYYKEINKGLKLEPDFGKWLSGGSDGSVASAEEGLTVGPNCIDNWESFTEDFEIDEIELDVTCRLPGMYLKTKGFIDRVGTHAEHGRMIVDIKTGKNPPKDKGAQLGTYSALLAVSTGELITKGGYYMARENKLKVYDLSEHTPEGVGGKFLKTLRDINTSDFEAKEEFTCRFCDQQLNCFAYSGDSQRTRYYDPSNPRFDKNREIPF